MNEAKILLHYAVNKASKNSDPNSSEVNSELIQACKIISDFLPNEDGDKMLTSLHEILPKMIKMLPYLPKPLEMLISTFIDKFVATGEAVSFFYKSFVDEFGEAYIDLSSPKIAINGEWYFCGEYIRIKCCEFLLKLFTILKRKVLKKLQPSVAEFLKNDFFFLYPGREFGVKIVEFLKKRLKHRLFESLEIDFLEDEETRQMRLKAKRQNYTYFEGDVEEDSDEISDLDEETLNTMNMNNKLLLKVEKKIDKLEKHLNNVPTKEDKIRFQRIYLTKDENLTIAFTVICKPHDFESKNEWKFRKDIDYNDELLYQSNVSYLLKSNKIMDYINRDIMNKDLYRSFLMLNVMIDNNTIDFLSKKVDEFYKKAFESIKIGLTSSKNAFLPHVVTLMKALKQHDCEQSIEQILSSRILCLCIQYLDNTSITQFLTELITNKPPTMTVKNHDRVIKYLIQRQKIFETIMDMVIGNNKKMNMLVKYGEGKATEEDRKHPEFDDPLLELENIPRSPTMIPDNRGFSESYSYKEYTETRITNVQGTKMSQEYTRDTINFLFNVVNSYLYKTLDPQDPIYSIPLMKYLFGDEQQVLVRCLYTHAVRIYHSDDHNSECIDFLTMLCNIIKNILDPKTKCKFLIEYKALIKEELRHHFLTLENLIVDELKTPIEITSKKLILLELLCCQIELDSELTRYISPKCWDRLVDHFFNHEAVDQKVSRIKLSYIFKILFDSRFVSVSTKNYGKALTTKLMNLVCSQNILANIVLIFEAKCDIQLYKCAPKIFLCDELYSYCCSFVKVLYPIATKYGVDNDDGHEELNQLAAQLNFSSNWQKILQYIESLGITKTFDESMIETNSEDLEEMLDNELDQSSKHWEKIETFGNQVITEEHKIQQDFGKIDSIKNFMAGSGQGDSFGSDHELGDINEASVDSVEQSKEKDESSGELFEISH
ncbi:unnamed protein product [Moneuplotes crassus]|uniref:Uncharacterized protein n=1 Tax=Euplotes crassus TaxID=5936 RepID=A0AAD1XQ50_EUPCR|nr:unnamed protein product [Moneuplotes crassus]